MRVLHGITRLGGAGVERQVRNLLCGTQLNEIQHSVFSFMGGSFVEELQGHGVTIHHHALGGKRLPLALKKIVEIIGQEKPDVLDGWDPQFDVLFGIASKLTGKPMVGSERSSALQYKIEGGHNKAWFKHLRGPVLRSCAKVVIANSKAGARYIDEITGGKVRTGVIRNGINWDEMLKQVAKGRPEGFADKPYMLIANRLNPPKRTQLGIDIFQIASAKHPDLHLVILGQGPDEQLLKDYVVAKGLTDRVHLLGQVPNISTFAANAQMFLSASVVEGMPNSVVETMGLGTPAVVSNIEAHEELFEASGGGLVLFDPEKPDEAAAEVSRLMTDSNHRNEIVEKASRFARSCTIDKMVGEYVHLYRELVR